MSEEKKQPWWKNCTIQHHEFATRKQLEQHIRSIVNSVPNGVPLCDEDHDFMTAVLQHHPEFEDKYWGTYAIVVDTPPQYPQQRCFWFVKSDESRIDISWLVALNASHRTKLADLSGAMRNAVSGQVSEARSALVGSLCPVCGVVVRVGDIDHRGVPFAQIRDMWLDEQLFDVALVDVGTSADFEDPTQKADWVEFHRLWADLRLLHTHCHKVVTHRSGATV